jgi:hypothetical protein
VEAGQGKGRIRVGDGAQVQRSKYWSYEEAKKMMRLFNGGGVVTLKPVKEPVRRRRERERYLCWIEGDEEKRNMSNKAV